MALWFAWFRAKFHRDEGSVIIPFALALPALAVALGAAIDLNKIQSTRSSVQAALDAAVLAAFDDSTTPSPIRAQNFFKARAPTSSSELPTFSVSGNRIRGIITVTVKTPVLSLVSLTSVNMTITAAALAARTQGITSITATPISAKGAWDKQIYINVMNKTGRIVSNPMLLDYNYEYPKSYFSPPVGSWKSYTIPEYQSYNYELIIFTDPTYMGLHINSISLKSDDPDAARHRKTTGNCADPAGQTDSWEDGGNYDYDDFVLNIKCTMGPNGPLKVQLVE